MRRPQPITKRPKFSSITHVKFLQWLHGKQQQHDIIIDWFGTDDPEKIVPQISVNKIFAPDIPQLGKYF